MADDAFSAALAYVLANEGSAYTDLAADAGGPTRYGITMGTLRVWRIRQGRAFPSPDDVKNIAMQEVSDIYRQMYWQPMGCALMTDSSIATIVFDASVLCGRDWAARCLQSACNAATNAGLKIDGQAGPKTLTAVNICPRRPFITAFAAAQQNRYIDICTQNESQKVFLKTWLRRVSQYLLFCC